ncbi:hypothetical protein F4680DRAFT_262233 [Xylaria scruposa]|nr:hypothetical protein F4680DRAFT_262233 [Xylaria scruposa]
MITIIRTKSDGKLNRREADRTWLHHSNYRLISIMLYLQSDKLSGSPFLGTLNWLKPRGLNRVFNSVYPRTVKQYNQFILTAYASNCVAIEETPNLFYFQSEARGPGTNKLTYSEDNMRAESNALIIAGSDATSVTLSGLFFYLASDQSRC